MPDASAPLVMCLACEAEDLPSRIEEIETLASTLRGAAVVHSVSGRTTALRVSVPVSHAARFHTALALAGAESIGPIHDEEPSSFVVILTVEVTAHERQTR